MLLKSQSSRLMDEVPNLVKLVSKNEMDVWVKFESVGPNLW